MVSQLPAYLQNRQSRTVTDRAASGLGASMPPHISIQGNSFTLVDAAGNEQTEGPVIDLCIADISDVNCKRYMDPTKPWTPDSNDPPLCWSSNGVGPSREAAKPQNSICATCPKNERGSAVSKLSGASIKACRDEKWLAVVLPKYPDMLFRLVLTPGSFDNWRDFLKPFETHGIDISDSVTRISFEPKKNGVLQFAPAQLPQGGIIWIDENTFKTREASLLAKATDLLVGRTDVPIQAAIAAPIQQPAQQIEQQLTPQPVTLGAFGTNGAATQTQAEQPAPRRRQRQTAQAEPQGQSATPFVGQQAGTATSPSNAFGGQPAQTAPFMPPQAETAQQAPFGVAQGAEPNKDLTAALDNLFGKK